MSRLKVFRTSIGFHDAYVAAPSRKAALKAWGTGTDLFARGAAEQVTEEAAMTEPLAHPGKVFKRSRGSAEDHLAAAAPIAKNGRARPSPRAKAKAIPRPSRESLSRAEEERDACRQSLDAEIAALEKERASLDRSIARQRATARRTVETLERAVKKERDTYDKAMEKWRSA
ncbi:MAG: hypothetical protein DI606_20180 [Sphingobium sp.]|uniref:hypothetical protein n=1 Tax=Sphingobium sp. TaxID=1912891 RepID=UPI000DB48C0C|nr:hypothetical protein [Sphingobium sp.]PZU05056.1 MAG: hypothetical protein DI606_20180 [Sphingobium sp.]